MHFKHEKYYTEYVAINKKNIRLSNLIKTRTFIVYCEYSENCCMISWTLLLPICCSSISFKLSTICKRLVSISCCCLAFLWYSFAFFISESIFRRSCFSLIDNEITLSKALIEVEPAYWFCRNPMTSMYILQKIPISKMRVFTAKRSEANLPPTTSSYYIQFNSYFWRLYLKF